MGCVFPFAARQCSGTRSNKAGARRRPGNNHSRSHIWNGLVQISGLSQRHITRPKKQNKQTKQPAECNAAKPIPTHNTPCPGRSILKKLTVEKIWYDFEECKIFWLFNTDCDFCAQLDTFCYFAQKHVFGSIWIGGGGCFGHGVRVQVKLINLI